MVVKISCEDLRLVVKTSQNLLACVPHMMCGDQLGMVEAYRKVTSTCNAQLKNGVAPQAAEGGSAFSALKSTARMAI